LRDLFKVLPDVYPVGRLDYDSEGLLILTNDTSLNHRLLNPAFKHERNIGYRWKVSSIKRLFKLAAGVSININGKNYVTRPAKVKLLKDWSAIPERIPPIRFRKSIATPGSA